MFGVENEPGKAPSLKDVAQHICNISLSANRTHDSVQDAVIAMKCVHQLVNDQNEKEQTAGRAMTASEIMNAMNPLPLVPRSSGNSLPQPSNQCLMVHRIPASYSEDDIKLMFSNCSYIVPQTIQPFNNSEENTGKTVVAFSTEAHANLAFDSLSGPNRPDKNNKAQKRVYLKNGGHICVRKY